LIKTLEVIEANEIEADEKMNFGGETKDDYAFFELNLMD